jgi:hypothetical protein
MFPLPRSGTRPEDLVVLCPASRAAAEAYVRAHFEAKITKLESEQAYYRRRRDRVAANLRFREINTLRLRIGDLALPPECRDAFSGSIIEDLIREWLETPDVSDVVLAGSSPVACASL